MWTPERWVELFVEYLGLRADVKEAVRLGKTVVVTDSDIVKTCSLDAVASLELEAGGRDLIDGAVSAVKTLSSTTPGKLIITRTRGGQQAISSLRAEDVGRLVSVPALVKSRLEAHPRIQKAAWQCGRCGCIHYVDQVGVRKLREPLECSKDNGGCGRAAGSTKFILLDHPIMWRKILYQKSQFKNEQWLEVQEPPEDLEGEAKPISKKVRLCGADMVNSVLPGDKVTIHGILELDNEDNKLLSPPTFIDAHHVEVHNTVEVDLTTEEVAKFKMFAESEDPLKNIIVPSIAPHIKGWEDVKEALALSLFGGLSKKLDTMPVRDTIHIGMFGDPGTAKTELMRFVCAVSPRGRFANARGSSEVGLTAAMVPRKEDGEGSWSLEAGALVLADRGICGIDEAGEFEDGQFQALNECMEQQTITVTKATVSTTLNARTSVVLAGNAKGGGKWDDEMRIGDQVDIPSSTLSRIDLFFIMHDDTAKDGDVREHIKGYFGVGPAPKAAPLTPKELRKYVILARRCNPFPTEEMFEHIDKYHAAIRAGVKTPHTHRTYYGLIRLSVAVARSRFSDTVTAADALEAIRIHSAGWKFAVIDEMFDIDVICTGISHAQRERNRIILDIIDKLSKGGKSASLTEIYDEAAGFNIDRAQTMEILARLVQDGRAYQPAHERYRCV